MLTVELEASHLKKLGLQMPNWMKPTPMGTTAGVHPLQVQKAQLEVQVEVVVAVVSSPVSGL